MESHAPIDACSDASSLHHALVDNLKSQGCLKTPQVEKAFREVPRHLFLPGVPLDKVYRNEAIITRRLFGVPASSSSAPYIMAVILEQLGLEPGHRVLEIGAGTGYNAAIMAHMVGDTGQVVTMDIDEYLVTGAREHLAVAGFGRVEVVCGDGGFGYPKAALYDRILLAVGAGDIVPAWREQLRPGGRLVLPLSIRGAQRSVAFEQADGYLVSVSIKDCDFMRLRGAFAGPETLVPLGPELGLYIWFYDDRRPADAEALYRSLTGSRRDCPTAVRITHREAFGGLALWLALREPGLCQLGAAGEWANRGMVPCLFFDSTVRHCYTCGLLEGENLCVLMRPPDQSPSLDLPYGFDPSPFDLFVRSFGPDDTLVHRLIDQVIAWDTADRPSTEGLHIKAYPLDADYVPSANEFVVLKRWTRLVVNWP